MRKSKMAKLTALFAGGMLLASGCTMSDVRANVVAGTMGYVEASAEAFWHAVLPVEDWLTGGE